MKTVTKLVMLGLCILSAATARGAADNKSTDLPDSYGPATWKTSSELRQFLFKALSKDHSPLNYKNARKYMFGDLNLMGATTSTYEISTYYCHQILSNKDMSSKKQLGPMKIPDDKVLNAEHSWPQSKFTGQFDKETQKGDLHILFPVQSVVNSIRGNFPYGEVVTPMNSPCPEAALGKNAEGQTAFEPGDTDKGDVARAVFYFSMRYKAKVDDVEEAYLRKWHILDPPDADEIQHNEEIYAIQKNRNPFVDAPKLVEKIDNF